MGIGTVFTVLEWAAALILAEITVSCLVRAACVRWGFLARRGIPTADYGLLLPNVTGCGFFAALAFVGVVPLLTAPSAAALFAVAALPFMNTVRLGMKQGKIAAWREVTAVLGYLARTSWSFLRGDIRTLLRRGEDTSMPPRPAANPAAAASRPAAPAGDPAAAHRAVPPLREDQAIAPVPHPAEVATALAGEGVEVPELYRALAEWIAGQDPETDADQSRFLRGCAAGKIAVAEAWQAHGENMVSGVGLDPSYGAAVFDMADSEAATASDAVLVDRRYHVIYGEVKAAVDNGLILPHKARQFFGGAGENAA